MTQRAKLELEINKPTEVELLYDECVEGSNQYGQYYLYAIKANDGREYSYFPPASVHDQLKYLRRGDKATVTKLAAKRGSKIITTYDVKTSATKEPVTTTSLIEEPIQEEEEQSEPIDRYYETILQSYRDALNIQTELNGLVDVNKIAVTLFIARSKSNGF